VPPYRWVRRVWFGSSKGMGACFARPPRLRPISTVGCGDATVAGFAVAAARGVNGEAAIKLASACGAANCSAEAPKL
jgi:fructose-1-phosphate kinase PfkB-like protein